MTSLKEFFTIIIDSFIFVPTIKEDDKYIYVEYINTTLPNRGFAIKKPSNFRTSKKSITADLYSDLQKRVLL